MRVGYHFRKKEKGGNLRIRDCMSFTNFFCDQKKSSKTWQNLKGGGYTYYTFYHFTTYTMKKPHVARESSNWRKNRASKLVKPVSTLLLFGALTGLALESCDSSQKWWEKAQLELAELWFDTLSISMLHGQGAQFHAMNPEAWEVFNQWTEENPIPTQKQMEWMVMDPYRFLWVIQHRFNLNFITQLTPEAASILKHRFGSPMTVELLGLKKLDKKTAESMSGGTRKSSDWEEFEIDPDDRPTLRISRAISTREIEEILSQSWKVEYAD